ncbi:unnamed protein product [Ceutorhynchus assimilis]|uniref:Cathepsin L n=1 Tax=Ceutorhynchus assimilis TaxID=467358 RepID=A0A9P0GJK1_9CUCU|nr:unnamed protein product [Ceutorhynchus assimilis]CAH1124320.1 unnamed protein product [Ceutorhynchus assimilis]
MKVFFLASLLVVAASASLLQEHAVKFQAFKMVHGKSYLNQVEETKRFSIFRDNLRAIEEHNALYEQGLVSYKQKITKFADKTQEEFKAYLSLHKKPTLLKTTKYIKTGVAVPDSVDWRAQGQVTGVKDQADCGSCWAFSLTGSTEGAHYRKTGKLVALSEQQLIDCTTDLNYGCEGGYLDQSFPYVEEKGLQSEESYPYEAEDGTCRYNASAVVTKTTSHVSIEAEDESALLEVVATIGPVSVAINADYITYYASGVFEDERCTADGLDHGVLVVGYGTENGKDYWIVKNSWGAEWGDEGYFKLARGTNECGIAEDTVYPVIA